MERLATTRSDNALLRPVVDLAGWLRFAATPTFALMAAISAANSAGMPICSAVSSLVPINEMALMYLLMSFFHMSPWLQFLPSRRAASHHTITQMQGD